MTERSIAYNNAPSPLVNGGLRQKGLGAHMHLVSAHGVAEETGEYPSNNGTQDQGTLDPGTRATFSYALKKVQVEAVRRTADAHICRLLKLANLLDDPLAVECPKEERALCTEDIRETVNLLEECLHVLADAAESHKG